MGAPGKTPCGWKGTSYLAPPRGSGMGPGKVWKDLDGNAQSMTGRQPHWCPLFGPYMSMPRLDSTFLNSLSSQRAKLWISSSRAISGSWEAKWNRSSPNNVKESKFLPAGVTSNLQGTSDQLLNTSDTEHFLLITIFTQKCLHATYVLLWALNSEIPYVAFVAYPSMKEHCISVSSISLLIISTQDKFKATLWNERYYPKRNSWT